MRHKNRRKHSQHFKLLFSTINLHFIISYHKPDLSLAIEMQGRPKQTTVYHTFFFLLCLKRNDPQIFKSGSSKNVFLHCVSYCYNLLQSRFFILCDNKKTLLLKIVSRYSEIVLTAMLLLSLRPPF